MKYKILQSSSKGNSFLFADFILLDTGISWKKLNKLCNVSKIEYVLLTHDHGDHLNKSIIQKLYVNTECKFICGEWLKDELDLYLDRVKIIEVGKLYNLKGVIISAVQLFHDVPNIGYRLMQDGHKHIHITDTFSVYGIKAMNYDSATIEANHDIDRALELIEEAKENGVFSHLTGALNSHLSVDKTIEFLRLNKIKKFDIVHVGSSTKKEVLKKIEKFRNENNIIKRVHDG